MSFYTPKSDMTIDGSDENSNVKNFEKIPEGTKATAKITKAELIEKEDGAKYYQIEYELTGGEFTGFNVRQNIKAFDADPRKRDRGVNQIVRIFKLCDYKPSHSLAPTTDDLQPLVKKYVGLVIGQWWQGEKGGNFIRETHTAQGFECKTGVFKEQPHPLDSVPPAYQPDPQLQPQDDIPF
jgi:hypothetical protein